MKPNLNMNWTRMLSLLFVASMALLSCGGSDDSDDTIPPTPNPPTPTTKGKFLTMTAELPAKASEEILTLTGLSSSISEMAGASNSSALSTQHSELMKGWTDNYIRLCRPYDPALAGTIEDVTITTENIVYER